MPPFVFYLEIPIQKESKNLMKSHFYFLFPCDFFERITASNKYFDIGTTIIFMVYFFNEIFVLIFFNDSVKHIYFFEAFSKEFFKWRCLLFGAIQPIFDQAKKWNNFFFVKFFVNHEFLVVPMPQIDYWNIFYMNDWNIERFGKRIGVAV